MYSTFIVESFIWKRDFVSAKLSGSHIERAKISLSISASALLKQELKNNVSAKK